MSKFDAIFNEIRFSEKYLRTSELGTCDAVFHKCFFFWKYWSHLRAVYRCDNQRLSITKPMFFSM